MKHPTTSPRLHPQLSDRAGRWLNTRVVPWQNGTDQMKLLSGLLLTTLVLSALSFWLRMYLHWRGLYDPGTGVYLTGQMMPTYRYLFGPESSLFSISVCFAFVLLAMGMVLFAVWNYLGFYRKSKSIYLMRRLPDRWEVPRRCLTLPLLTVLAGVLLSLLLALLFLPLYLTLPPREAIPPDALSFF